MTDEERELVAHVSTDPTAQVKNRLKLSEIRIRRMMFRIQQEEQEENTNPAVIRAIEEAITRVEMNMVNLIRESSRLIEMQGNKSDGSLDKLAEILDQARKQYCK
ncbi:hypothetical protein [uncultured Brevibacillus sp.]|uniref:hypothetical protein n=1 Tax=uncultured Brevibacillus sp. TaxID=169970 RepID=UPI0025926961|nr:hypothetical protein [uncultured Brevibacillus sp.]